MTESEQNKIAMMMAFAASALSSLVVMIMFCVLFRMHEKIETRVENLENNRRLGMG